MVDKVALAISIGCVGGIGINTAHELGHKKESHERWLSKIALAQSFYGHFYIEHNRGHHVRVATPEDPASSRVGESFYRFWPRTVFGSLKSAWRLEKRRYARRGKHPFRIGNDVLNAWLMSVALWGAMVAWLGAGVLPYLLIQAVVGFSLLEVVNYLEHYGMLRQRVGVPGKERFEKVAPSHSWNSNNIATNVLLYHLQRHSDHHANPTRRYQTLRDFEESPVLPTGYAGMIVLALLPPLWRRVMDPRVLAHVDGDMSRANIDPRKRAQILAAYDAPGATSPAGTTSAAGAAGGAGTTSAAGATSVACAAGAAGTASTSDVASSAVAAQSAMPVRLAMAVDAARETRPVVLPALADEHGGQCPGCGYVYDEATGAPREGFPAGTPWSAVPENWCCPDCGVREKADFVVPGTVTV